MATYRFAKDHEWIDDEGRVGISEYAQEQLGDVVFVELPEVGRTLAKGDEASVVESVKAASEVYAPVDGAVTEVNSALDDAPETVNEDAQGKGWFFRMSIADASQLDELMDQAAYDEYVKTLE